MAYRLLHTPSPIGVLHNAIAGIGLVAFGGHVGAGTVLVEEKTGAAANGGERAARRVVGVRLVDRGDDGKAEYLTPVATVDGDGEDGARGIVILAAIWLRLLMDGMTCTGCQPPWCGERVFLDVATGGGAETNAGRAEKRAAEKSGDDE